MIDLSQVKLGKLPPIFKASTLHLENYMDVGKLPPLPDTSDWFAKTSPFPMAGNDKYGLCGPAGASHIIQTLTANAGRHEEIIPDKTVIDTYFEYTGGRDIGVNLEEFQKFWRKIGIAGHKIGLYAAIDPQNILSLRYCNFLFGSIYMGFMLPESIEGQRIWDVPKGGPVGKGQPGSLGGHCVNGGVTTPRMLQVGTWGMKQWATMDFVGQYCDEAWAIISLEWFKTDHKTPTGLAWKDLVSDLKNRVVTG